jgi:hypothetical protein
MTLDIRVTIDRRAPHRPQLRDPKARDELADVVLLANASRGRTCILPARPQPARRARGMLGKPSRLRRPREGGVGRDSRPRWTNVLVVL